MRGPQVTMALAALLVVGLDGCSSTGGTVAMNSAAHQKGPIKVALVKMGPGVGVVQMTMADGEVLNGQYSQSLSPDAADGLLLGMTEAPVRFWASGPRTTLTCQGRRMLAGSGTAQCQSQHGAVWTVNW
jgi:hypothetical protein